MMTNHSAPARGPEASILVLSQNLAVAESVNRAFGGHQDRVTVETGSVRTLNGRASSLVASHDVVIFDAGTAEGEDVEAISGLAGRRPGGPIFVALADDDLSIAQARRLREGGVEEVLPGTIDASELRRAIDGLVAARKARQSTDPDLGRVIAVVQARGGVGATTVAVNLARKLMGHAGFFGRGRQRKVALVDLDLQFGSVGALLDLEGKGGLMEYIEHGMPPEAEGMKKIIQAHDSGLDVVTAPAAMAPLNALTPDSVARLIDTLRTDHDAVVVDLPHALVEWVAPVLKRCSRVVMVTDTSVPAIRQAKRLIDFYAEVAGDLRVEVVVNRETRPLMKSGQIKEAEGVLERPLSHWLPEAPKEARRAADIGRAVVDLYPRAKISRAFEKLAKSVGAELAAATKQSA